MVYHCRELAVDLGQRRPILDEVGARKARFERGTARVERYTGQSARRQGGDERAERAVAKGIADRGHGHLHRLSSMA